MTEKNSNKSASIAVIALGAAAALGQLLLFRELCSLSLGGEMAVGLIFSGWLGGVALGGAAHGIVSRRANSSPDPAPAALLLAASLPGVIILARALRPIAGYGRGESLAFTTLCWMIPLVSAMPAALSGYAFAAFCSRLRSGGADSAPARAYALDAAGSLAAMLLYSLILVFAAGPMRLASAAAVMMCAAVAACSGRGGVYQKVSLAALCVLALFLVFVSGPADRWSRRVQWAGMHVDTVQESPYANLTVTTDGGQAAIYANGRLAGTAPEPVTAAFDAHVPLSLVENPRDALVVGGGPSIIREILKHGVRRATAAEIDPVMIALRERYMSPSEVTVMRGPRVRIEITDARKLISSGGGKYDAIIMRAGEPDTLLVNRYYTLEFFRATRARLRAGGIFSMRIQFQENSMSAQQADLLGTHVRTMTEAFGARPLPVLAGQGALLLERNGARLDYDLPRAMGNFGARKIVSEDFGPELLAQALDRGRNEQALQQREITGPDLGGYFSAPGKTDWALRRLAARPGASMNRDFTPVSVFMQLRAASEQSGAVGRAVFKYAARAVPAGWVAVALAVCALAVLRGGSDGGARAVPAAMAAGFAAMGVEIAAVFVYQLLNGNIYYFVGLIIAAFMAGGWAGGRLAEGAVRRGAGGSAAAACLGALCVLCLCVAGAAGFGSAGGGLAGVFAAGFVFAAGGLAGAVYSFLAAGAGEGWAGPLYAADHAGAAAGALLAGVFIIPSSGVPRAMLLCALTAALGILPLLIPRARLARGRRG